MNCLSIYMKRDHYRRRIYEDIEFLKGFTEKTESAFVPVPFLR